MLLGLAFLAFVSLGLPDGVLGVAWPSVRRTFSLPLSDLGMLLAVATGGYLVSSVASGSLVARIGVGRLLVWSSAATVASAVDYALAPAWPVMVAGAAPAGLGSGAIDAGMHMALFFVYTGLEVTVGQWTYSLLTEARGVEMATAGGWISAYWGSLALGRLAVGALTRRFTATTLLRISMGLAPAGALLLWSDHSRLSSLLALLMLGFSVAPVFPLLISETPRRLGTAAARHAIGFQIAAAYLGTATLPGGAGVLARWNGLEVIGPLLLAASMVLFSLHELALWRATRARRGAAAFIRRAGATA